MMNSTIQQARAELLRSQRVHRLKSYCAVTGVAIGLAFLSLAAGSFLSSLISVGAPSGVAVPLFFLLLFWSGWGMMWLNTRHR